MLEEDLEVVDGEVGDADGLGQAGLLDLLHLRPCRRDVAVAESRVVDEEQVDVLEPELQRGTAREISRQWKEQRRRSTQRNECADLFERLVDGLLGSLAIEPTPLGRDPDGVPLKPALSDSQTGLGLVPVRLRRVNVFEAYLDGLVDLVGAGGERRGQSEIGEGRVLERAKGWT